MPLTSRPPSPIVLSGEGVCRVVKVRKTKRPPPQVCPSCGVDVPRTAQACPECGADHQTGWNEDQAVYDGLDLPEGDFDYGEFVRRELGGATGTRRGRTVLWIVVGVIAGIAFLFTLFC
jgi:hypothetical protein